ncbi:Transglutaminase-like domain protein [Tsuneonella dongtanensis]|uniref:Transglutaminase-like domain protein n=1 Tax=Tsuneonella dongtanensis TaxID=692370 RepID=A0A1B2AC03_9SPHN|nr:transglutaminase-like cysteine peptidase [Tsuneonella dongtanensis]ANY19667.1 Transglutaminase-like domain protein [Tsuneonella dongtanensis]
MAAFALVAAPMPVAAQETAAAPTPACDAKPEPFVMPTTGAVFTLPPEPDTLAACEPPPPPPPPRPPAPSLFRMVAMPIGGNAVASKWDAARAGVITDRSGPWDELMSEVRRLPAADPISMVNQWVNWHVRFRDDAGRDEWSPAAETLIRGYGDCEDFALAKMGLLLALGVPGDDMYLVLLRDRAATDHAVLAVSRNGQLFVLDNRTDKILPASAIADYTPVISFSGQYAWTYGHRAAAR